MEFFQSIYLLQPIYKTLLESVFVLHIALVSLEYVTSQVVMIGESFPKYYFDNQLVVSYRGYLYEAIDYLIEWVNLRHYIL